MRGYSAPLLLLLATAESLACTPSRAGATSPQTPPEESPDSSTEGTSDSTERTGEEDASADAPGDPETGPHPAVDGRAPDPSRALPELSFQHLGMHIGGESNSPESKQPWFLDIESQTDALLLCYRLVDAPEKGGSYGVDLYVSKTGSVEVRGSRQKVGGDAFDQCMRQVFSTIKYHMPERPTVLSYSLLFTLGDS